MKWKKYDLVFDPSVLNWSHDSALQPTPLVLSDRVRVFFGSRDSSGVSRIGFVDLNKDDPSEMLGFSKEPVLNIGRDGCFDDSGVVPSAVVELDGLIYLFYAGYQITTKVRFSVLGGVAVSKNNGLTFERIQEVPAFERNTNETLFRVPHSVLYDKGVWKAFYGGGSEFRVGKSKTLPVYDIRYTESDTPFKFDEQGQVLLTTDDDEYRLGRPYFFKKSEDEYLLFYGYSTEESPYLLGVAFSKDGINWERRDDELNLKMSKDGWDSQMIAYPSVVRLNDKIYMFYNGNEYGRFGFGLAELLSW